MGQIFAQVPSRELADNPASVFMWCQSDMVLLMKKYGSAHDLVIFS